MDATPSPPGSSPPPPPPPLEPTPGLRVAARYERTVAASLERVWENVLDWEHLPWLHARAFEGIEEIEAGAWGWRGQLTSTGGGRSRLTLLVDRDAGHYVARTGDLPGPVSEIWTELEAVEAQATRVRVAFHVPEMPTESLERLGRIYVELYTGLWDEDEEMMRERAARLAERTRPPPDTAVDLGSETEVRARLPLDVVFGGRRFRVIDRAGELVAHASVCPHLLGPLFPVDGEDDALECPWHGYTYSIAEGRSCDGRGLRLPPAPRIEIDPATGQCRLTRGG